MSTVGVPEALRAGAQRIADAFTGYTGVSVDAGTLLTGRAALSGLTSRGQISAGGATRLVRGADSWCAITLSRPDDVQAVPALIEAAATAVDPWPPLQRWASERPVAEVVDRARLLGLPAAVLGESAAGGPVIRPLGERRQRRVGDLLVADLSSMWAGPLCGHLLRETGAVVVKAESARRPDGTRSGVTAFYDWMNAGKLSYAVEFDDHAAMIRLLSAADVVIESSRPAALARRGLGPGDIPPRPGRTWVRITGYGADGERGSRVAFGDDAAVAGGLVDYGPHGPEFVGDAVADPLTGLHAARAVAESLSHGGGRLIEVSMSATAAGYAGFVGGPVRESSAPVPGRSAPGLGADDSAVHALLDERHSPSC